MNYVCDEEQLFGTAFAEAISVDDECGAGTSDVDLSANDYLQVISDAIPLLESVESFSFIIPEDEIDTHCQVRRLAHASNVHDAVGNKTS